jgi:hypothetical protein
VYLRLPQSVQVGDVEGAPHCSSVHSSCPTLLQTQVVQDFAKARILGQIKTGSLKSTVTLKQIPFKTNYRKSLIIIRDCKIAAPKNFIR